MLVRQGHLKLDARLLGRAPSILLAALAMAAVLAVLGHLLFADPFALPRQSSASRLAGLAVLIAAGMLTYGVVGQALGGFDMRLERDMVARRFLRMRRGSVISARPTDP
jgi:hypothetical protein